MLHGLHTNTHLPALVAAARGATEEAALGGGGGGGRAAELLRATVNAYCMIQLGCARTPPAQLLNTCLEVI